MNDLSSLNKNDRAVLEAMIKIFIKKKLHKEPDTGWVTTRDIAEYCDITIYKARYSLLKLEGVGAIIHRSEKQKRIFSWKPTGDMV